jgi:TetR/AcrR family transcriptional regulator, cholesterol catabolism regulator
VPQIVVTEPTRRQDLINIAAKEFSRRGYRATTMRHIADAAGILPGSLYHHFKSKEEILREVMLESTAEYATQLERIAKSDSSAPHKIRAAFEQRLELYREHGLSLSVVLQTDTTTLREDAFEEMRDLGKRIDRAWDNILERGIAEGSLRADLEVRATTYAIVGMLNWAHRWYDPDGRLSPQQLAAHWSRLLLDGLEVRT